MVENGCGFDVASKKELDQVLKYNINKENIVFANPCKPNSHIKFAAGKKCVQDRPNPSRDSWAGSIRVKFFRIKLIYVFSQPSQDDDF